MSTACTLVGPTISDIGKESYSSLTCALPLNNINRSNQDLSLPIGQACNPESRDYEAGNRL